MTAEYRIADRAVTEIWVYIVSEIVCSNIDFYCMRHIRRVLNTLDNDFLIKDHRMVNSAVLGSESFLIGVLLDPIH